MATRRTLELCLVRRQPGALRFDGVRQLAVLVGFRQHQAHHVIQHSVDGVGVGCAVHFEVRQTVVGGEAQYPLQLHLAAGGT